MKYIATVDGQDIEIDLERQGEVQLGDAVLQTDLRAIDGSSYSLLLDHRSYEVFVERQAGRYVIMIDGDQFLVEVEDARLKQLRAMGGAAHEESGSAQVVAPMPGLVVKVLVAPGDVVEAGQGVLILEAMKMENELRSPRAGVVRQVSAVPGQTVAQGELLIRVDEGEA